MDISITRALNLAAATHLLPILDSLVTWRRSNRSSADAVALVVPESEWPEELGVDASLLVLVVPDELETEVPKLALASADVYNLQSDDLLTSRTLLGFEAGQTCLEVDAWAGDFPRPSATGKFFVGLVAGERFVLAKHDLGDEGLEGLLQSIQGACSSSGPNYRPYRLWSQEQLDAAARGEDVVGPSPWFEKNTRRVNCEVLRLIEGPSSCSTPTPATTNGGRS
jgi:hypothetical protein